MTNPLTLRVDTVLLSRRLASGLSLVSPAATPSLSALGTEAQAVEDCELFLTEHLSRVSPEEVARHAVAPEAALREVRVLLPREDLPRRVRVKVPMTVHCLVVPDPKGLWVTVIALQHTVYLRADEDFEATVAHEVERLVGARELGADEYLQLLPPRGMALRPSSLEVERTERLPPGKVASLRRSLKERQRTREATEILASVARPLHLDRSQREPPLTGRDHALRQLAGLLDGRQRFSALVTGPSLSGRSALIAQWFAQRLGRDPKARLYLTNGAQLIAGMSGLGEWEERLKRVMEAAEFLDATLWFDNLGELFADGGGSAVDIPSALKPWIEDGRVRVVGELRDDLVDLAERRNGAFLNSFARVKLDAFSAAQTEDALKVRMAWERERPNSRRALLSDAGVATVIDLAERYLPYQSFPGKAFRLFEELRALHETRETQSEAAGASRVTLGPDDVHEGFSMQSGIPAFLLKERSALDLDAVCATLASRVIGQRDAVRRVGEVVCVVKARLQPVGRPLAVLLFVGPTGVGKTELARALAALLFGHEDRLLRFDMSEFTDAEAVDRLIRGTQGAEGLLTRKVREQPFAVLLLDEVEKAHPAVFDLLLQVLGEGRLTDGKGRTAWFHNTIVIMTSNLGVSTLREPVGFGAQGGADAAGHFVREVERSFRPEFVNRLDRVIAFSPLSHDEIRAVTRIAIERIARRRGLVAKGTSLTVSDAAIHALAAEGHSPRYGARALRRHLEDALVVPIARGMNEHRDPRQSLAAITVSLAHEAQAASVAGQIERAFDTPSLAIRALYTTGAERRRRDATLRAISRVRRGVDAAFKLGRVEALREELEYIETQLSQPTDESDRRTSIEIAQLQSRHHHLAGVYAQLVQPRDEINEIEDLAMVATFEGAPTEGLDGEERPIEQRFRRALVWALLAAETRRHAVTFLVTDLGPTPAWQHWLVPLIAAAEGRQWRVAVHFDGDASGDDPTWPAARRWGPPREGATRIAALEDPRRDPGSVLVTVEGPEAGLLLAPQAGRHTVKPVGGGTCEYFVEMLGMTSALSDAMWAHRVMLPPVPKALEALRRSPISLQISEREVDAPSWSEALPLPRDGALFGLLEELTLRVLLPYERDPNLDRDALFAGPLDLAFATAGDAP